MSTNDGANGGYGRPPKDGRFKPGCSGNPSGRPKGAHNLKTDLENILKKRVAIRENGKLRYGSSLEAIALKMYDTAAQGDTTASSQLFTISEKGELQDTPPSQPDVVTDNDRAIVEDFLRRNSVPRLATELTPAQRDAIYRSDPLALLKPLLTFSSPAGDLSQVGIMKPSLGACWTRTRRKPVNISTGHRDRSNHFWCRSRGWLSSWAMSQRTSSSVLVIRTILPTTLVHNAASSCNQIFTAGSSLQGSLGLPTTN